MFVVIQELQLKRENKGGAYKEYQICKTTMTNSDGTIVTHHSYHPNYEAGSFERPHREAYKVSIHHSYRENGAVKKKQCVLGTIDYYGINSLGWYDYLETGMSRAAELFEVDFDAVYDMVCTKLDPLKERIQKEYRKTEEYKTTRKREKILAEYQKAKAAFAKRYEVSEHEYDVCYNVFGETMNQEYLDSIIGNHHARARYYRSYSGYSNGNYGGGAHSWDNSGYFKLNSSNYSEVEKEMLKRFYKVLSLKFHPDLNGDTDTTKEMQLLNQLKEGWGV